MIQTHVAMSSLCLLGDPRNLSRVKSDPAGLQEQTCQLVTVEYNLDAEAKFLSSPIHQDQKITNNTQKLCEVQLDGLVPYTMIYCTILHMMELTA